jgi:hypothetical protein
MTEELMLRTKPIETELERLPDELTTLKQFVLYQWHMEAGEVKKRPFDWLGGSRGNNDPALWLPLADAIEKTRGRRDLGVGIYQPADGIRIACNAGEGYLHIIDCDGFVATLDGKQKLLDYGWDIIERCLGSYTEFSISGLGTKLLVVSDLEPQTKKIFKLPPNEFSRHHPDVKKYGSSHAVEVFSAGFWNVLTGVPIKADLRELKFVPKQTMLDLFKYLESLAPEPLSAQALTSVRGLGQLDKAGVLAALKRIDNQSEEHWNGVAYALARIMGNEGLDIYLAYSRGDYNGKPYLGFDENSVVKRYQRAMVEVARKPNGYGLTFLSRISGLSIEAITGQSPSHDQGVTAAALSRKVFPPLRWVINGILPEGSYLLSARPKVGKSWLALQICLGVAYGESVLGRNVEQGKAIYLALEDNERRLQSRLKQLRPSGFATDNLILHTNWQRFDQGGVQGLIETIEQHQPRIVVIDTLAKVRPPSGRNSGIYEADYGALAPITEVANRFRTTILIVHHNRKGKAESDPLEQISGSLGLAGAVDGTLIIDGNRGDASYTLTLIGRDIPNDDDLAITLESNGKWVVLGTAKEVFISEERQAIKQTLLLHPDGLKPSEVADITGKKPNGIRKLMVSMARDGQLVNTKGTYTLPPTLGNHSNGPHCSSSGNSGNSGSCADEDGTSSVTELPETPVLHG